MGAEFVHADLTELVSSQAKSDARRDRHVVALLQLYTSPRGTQRESFRSGVLNAARRLGEWAVAWGIAFYSYLLSHSLYF